MDHGLLALTVDVNLHGGGTSAWVPVITAALAGGAGLWGARTGANATLAAEAARHAREDAGKAEAEYKELKIAARELYTELVRNAAHLSAWEETDGKRRPSEMSSEHWKRYSVVIAANDDLLWRHCTGSYEMLSIFESMAQRLYSNPMWPPDATKIEMLKDQARRDAAIVDLAIQQLKTVAEVGDGVIKVKAPAPKKAEDDGKGPETAEAVLEAVIEEPVEPEPDSPES